MTQTENLLEYLLHLMTTEGINGMAGASLSFLVEVWPWFKRLLAWQKRLVFFALCLAVPLGSILLQAALGYVPWAAWRVNLRSAIEAGLYAICIGTLMHTRRLIRDPNS